MRIAGWVSDLRLALRALAKARGLAAVAICVLAVGIALNASVLSVLNAYLWKSLPYPAAERLYSIRYSAPNEMDPRGLADLDWRTLSDVIEHPIAWDLDVFFLVGGDHPEPASGAWVTPGFMQGLGIRPARGREFTAGEFQTGSPQVALISYGLWQSRFGGDADILGSRFQAYVSDRPEDPEEFTIIGVLPAGFWHFNRYVNVLTPLRAPTYPYMVRLREGVPVSRAEQRITEFVKQGISLPAEWRAQVRSVHDEYVARVRPTLRAVATAAGLVLLIACANIAFLLLIRGARRKREIAVRAALGANRWQIARMLMAEALVLGTAATVVGLVLTSFVLDGVAPLIQTQLGRPVPGGTAAIAIDRTVLAASIGLCLITALLFTLAPLWAAGRAQLSLAMQGGSRSGTEGRGSRRARSALIVLEVAASLFLLVGCGLMLSTILNMVRADLGFRAEEILVGNVGLRDQTYPDEASRQQFYQTLLHKLEAVPGVRAVALANFFALQQPRLQPIVAEGVSAPTELEAGLLAVSPRYFEVLGVQRLDGREFELADQTSAEPVALVSETVARRLWPQQRAVGQFLAVGGESDMMTRVAAVRRRVVGVVRDVRQDPADQELADVYVPLLQAPGRFTSVYFRTDWQASEALAALRSAVREIDPEVSLELRGRFGMLASEQLAGPQFLAGLLTAFGVFAAALAVVGVYGVTSYATRMREHEIAVRLAIGAEGRDVTRLFLQQGATVLALGIAAGLFGAHAMGKLLESQLHGVHAADLPTWIAATLLFGAAGLVAVWWPARRAARIDPAIVLRNE